MNNKSKYRISIYFIASLILLGPAFYNGFPLVFSDTGTYIGSGMTLEIPMDRPIFYGLFIRLCSFGFSLWIVVIVQALLMGYLLHQVFLLLFGSLFTRHFLVILVILSSFTGIGWYCGQLMPDVFSAMTILVLLLLVFYKKYSKSRNLLHVSIAVLSLLVHFSNVAIYFFLFCLVLFLSYLGKNKEDVQSSIRLKLAAIVFSLSLVIASVGNYFIGGSFSISQGSSVFLMGKMLDSGVLKSYLDDTCSSNPKVFCVFKDSLPSDSRSLLWDYESPTYQLGGWASSAETYSEVLQGIFTSPKHLFMYFQNCFFSSLSQFFQNDIGAGLTSSWYAQPDSPPYQQISKHFSHEMNPYLQSRQNGNLWGQGLDFTFLNHVYPLLLLGCLLYILFCFWQKEKRNRRLYFIGKVILAGIIFNAIVVASLANVYGRLQGRVSWLIVFFALVIWLESRKKEALPKEI